MHHSETETAERIRLDLWLYYARLAKTRALCRHFIVHSSIRLNGRSIKKPHTFLHVGDVLTFLPPSSAASHKAPSHAIVWRVLALGQRRGPAREAALLYQVIEERIENTEKA